MKLLMPALLVLALSACGTISPGQPYRDIIDFGQRQVRDGVVDVLDCRTPTGAYDPVSLHKGYFTENEFTGTSQCLNCHGKIGDDVMTTAHWKWEGVSTNIAGYEAGTHGKKDLINNFCQAVPSNGRLMKLKWMAMAMKKRPMNRCSAAVWCRRPKC